jgi:hypothetical protein
MKSNKPNLLKPLYFVDRGKAKDKTHIAQYNDGGVLVVPCVGKPLKETSLLQSLSATMRTEYWCKTCMKHLVRVMLARHIEGWV